MASFNKVVLMGNLTRDPEHRVTQSGHSICKLGLAVSRTYSTQSGEKREETTFVDVDAFGKQADTINKYMRKGNPMLIEGRLKLDQWESQDGQKRSKLGVVLESFQFLPSRQQEGSSQSGGYENSSPPARQPQASQTVPEENFDSEDVPF